MSILVFAVIFFMSYLTIVTGKLSCINENGNSVDMYVVYKLPRMHWGHRDYPKHIKEGHGYTYLDSDSNYKFSLSNISIGDDLSPVGRTMGQVYEAYNSNNERSHNSNDMAHIFYNDENPNGEVYFHSGHTKGALAFDQESGFWLIHSVPKFADPVGDDNKYQYPHNGCKYGQMFMCISFNSSVFDKIGYQLRFNNPHIHDSNLPEEWKHHFPNIKKLIKGKMMNGNPTSHVQRLHSLAGHSLIHLAKNNDFHHDLYKNLVAPKLQTNLFTETWQFGKIIGPSCKGRYKVLDIQNLVMDVDGGSFNFDVHDDHSKYAISNDEESYYVCIGDINRTFTQFKRGGGTMCIRNKILWTTFSNLIEETNHCD